jgi:tetratricopeptide (TPR) repeat protein
MRRNFLRAASVQSRMVVAFAAVALLGSPGPYLAGPLVQNNLQAAYDARSKGRMSEAEQLVEKAWEQIRAAGPGAGEAFASAVQQIAQFRFEQGLDLKAEAIYGSALDATLTLGEKSPVYQSLLSGLGQIYTQERRTVRAQRIFEQLLVIADRHPGLNPWVIRSTMSSLASLYEQAGNYAEAEALFKRMSEARYESGDGGAPTALDSSALAQFYFRRGRTGEAERMMRDGLAEAEQAPGTNSWLLVSRLNDLISILRSSQRYGEAEELETRVIAAQDASSQANGWIGFRFDVQQLAEMYFEAGDYKQAFNALNDEVSRLADLKGVQSPEYRQGLLSLATLQSRQNNYGEAEKTLQECLASTDAADPTRDTALWQLAEVYDRTGQPEKARDVREKIRQQQREREGPNTERDIQQAVEDANQAINGGEPDRAQDIAAHALAMAENSLGPSACFQIQALSSVARSIAAQGRMSAATQMIERMAQLADRAPCSQIPPHYSGTGILIEFEKSRGNWAEVERLLRLQLEKLEAANGVDSPALAQTLEELARAALNQDKPGAAESLWLEDLRIQEETQGAGHPALIQVLKFVAWFYDAANQPDKAERMWQRALALSEKSCAPTDPGFAYLLAEYADHLANLNELERAGARYQQALEMLRRLPGYAGSADDVASRYRALEARLQASRAAPTAPSPAPELQSAPR